MNFSSKRGIAQICHSSWRKTLVSPESETQATTQPKCTPENIQTERFVLGKRFAFQITIITKFFLTHNPPPSRCPQHWGMKMKHLRRIWLFLRIVWRRTDNIEPGIMSVAIDH